MGKGKDLSGEERATVHSKIKQLRAFDEYPADKLEDKWACYYNNLSSIMSCLGGNDYKQAHNEGKRRRRETGTSVDLSISLDDYDKCLAYIVE